MMSPWKSGHNTTITRYTILLLCATLCEQKLAEAFSNASRIAGCKYCSCWAFWLISASGLRLSVINCLKLLPLRSFGAQWHHTWTHVFASGIPPMMPSYASSCSIPPVLLSWVGVKPNHDCSASGLVVKNCKACAVASSTFISLDILEVSVIDSSLFISQLSINSIFCVLYLLVQLKKIVFVIWWLFILSSFAKAGLPFYS